MKIRGDLRKLARAIAKHGVNLVRIHGPATSTKPANVDPAKVKHAIDVVEAMKAEGIYTHFSIYFPLWFRPKAATRGSRATTAKNVPFAALYFNPDFQRAIPDVVEGPADHARARDRQQLVDEPAVSAVEMQNEDSLFLLDVQCPADIPDVAAADHRRPVRRLAEEKVRLARRRARSSGTARGTGRDNPAEGRVGFRPLWNMFNETLGPRQGHGPLPGSRASASFYTET